MIPTHPFGRTGHESSRIIFGAAALYLGGAWVALQVGLAVIPILGMPEWTARALFWLLVIGLPVTLALSWFFDFGLKGVTRTPDADDAPPAVL